MLLQYSKVNIQIGLNVIMLYILITNNQKKIKRNFCSITVRSQTIFGCSDIFLGLKYLEEMTAQGPSELRIELMAADNTYAYEIFQNFHIGTHPEYMLSIDKGTGSAGKMS